MNTIKVIAFDADDTLWANECHFQDIEKEYAGLLSEYMALKEISKELFITEMNNLDIYGFGIKSFVLSMVETALRISNNKIDPLKLETILNYGKQLLRMPVELLPDVGEVLTYLKKKYTLIIVTKGDLLDQERKIASSGLRKYFTHVEIMSSKSSDEYKNLLDRINCQPEEFLMIGNSVKSDILPVLEINGYAAHIPYYVTWEHEKNDSPILHSRYVSLNKLTDIYRYLE